MSDKIVVGLDIGTTKVCAVVATIRRTGPSPDPRGRRSRIRRVEPGCRREYRQDGGSRTRSHRRAERMAGVTVRNVIVGNCWRSRTKLSIPRCHHDI